MPLPSLPQRQSINNPVMYTQLPLVDDYLIRTLPDGQLELWHHAPEVGLVRTAIQRDENGLFINRWNANARRFSDETALNHFLGDEIRLYDVRQDEVLQAWVEAAPNLMERVSRQEVCRGFRLAHIRRGALFLVFAQLSSLPPVMPRRVHNISLLGCTLLTALSANLPESLLSISMVDSVGLTEIPVFPGKVISVTITNSPQLSQLPDWPAGLQYLELNRLISLTHLPALPRGLTSMVVEGATALTSLPVLPMGLQTLSLRGCSALTGVRLALTKITKLDLNGCRSLTTLLQFPETLMTLDLGDCSGLTGLPALPSGLTRIDLGGCSGLTGLPALPGGITYLNLSGCSGLAQLPALPSRLLELRLSGCQALTSLPALPSGLFHLDLSHCSALTQLPALPDSLLDLNLSGCSALTRLPEQRPAGLRRLNLSACTALTYLPDWVHLLDFFENSGSIAANRTSLEYWALRAGQGQDSIAAMNRDWQRLREEDGAVHFETLLRRLASSEVGRIGPSAAQVVNVIEALRQSPEARRMIFATAWDADRDCHDRPLLLFNDIQAIAEGARLVRSGAGPAGVLKLARSLYRQALLDSVVDDVMLKQWNEKIDSRQPLIETNRRRPSNAAGTGPNTTEGIEVQLALREKLRETLHLPFEVRGLHTHIARLNVSDMDYALQRVTERLSVHENEVEGVMAQPVWRHYLEQRYAAELEAAGGPYADEATALEATQSGLPDSERLPDQAYTDRFDTIARRRQAALDAVLRRHTDAAIQNTKNDVAWDQRLNAFYADYQERLYALCAHVQTYVREHPDSGRVPALLVFAGQLQALHKELGNEKRLPLDARKQRALRFAQGNPPLPTVEELMQQAQVRGKPIGQSYQGILDQLAALHARRLVLPEQPGAAVAPERERLLRWRMVRDQIAVPFAEAGRRLGARVRHAPQSIWLDTDSAVERRGRCTGLALAWAFDPSSDTLLDNVFSAAAHPDDAPALAFLSDIDALHRLGTSESLTRLEGVVNWDQAVDALERLQGRRALLVHAGNHSVALAAQGVGSDTRYAFFDPNAGAWRDIASAGQLRQALKAYFTPALQQHYGFSGAIEAHTVHAPDANRGLVAVWDRTRLPLPPGISPARPPSPVLAAAGTGLRLYGTYRALLSVKDLARQGRYAELGFELGNLGAIWLAEGVERGVARGGVPLAMAAQRPLSRAAGHLLAVGPSLARWLPASLPVLKGRLLSAFNHIVATGYTLGGTLVRGAGIAGQLLTLPFDLYRAITSFRQASSLTGLERQDALVSGSMATLGAAGGLVLAGAVFAGASLSLVGPLGLAFGVMMIAAAKIYQAVRMVQEVEQFITLTPLQRLDLGWRVFLGEAIDPNTHLAVHQARYGTVLKDSAERALETPSGQSIGLILYPAHKLEARMLGPTCNDDHAHEHVALVVTAPPPRKVLRNGVMLPLEPDPAERCPQFAPGHQHARRYGYELLARASDDQVDLARLSVSDAGVVAVARAPARIPPGSSGDDLFLLDHLPESGAPPLSFEGGGGAGLPVGGASAGRDGHGRCAGRSGEWPRRPVASRWGAEAGWQGERCRKPVCASRAAARGGEPPSVVW